MNHATLSLRRRPVIALIPTGDELVPPGQLPGPDQIVSSNVYGLAALLERLGALPRLLPIARDSEASLLASFDLAQDVDLIVTLGGASVGDHDLVQSAARTHGLDLSFHKVAMRPGKPLMSGRLRGTAMVGLPGNPVSAIACGVVFLQPMVRAFLGLDPALPRRIAALSHALGANGPREHYMRARLTPGTNGDALCVFERQDSALLSVLQQANCLAIRAPNAAAAQTGDLLEVLPLP